MNPPLTQPAAFGPAPLFGVLDSILCLIDLDANGPTGLNLSSVQAALDALADGAKRGWPITASTARYLQENGWDIGFPPNTKFRDAGGQSPASRTDAQPHSL